MRGVFGAVAVAGVCRRQETPAQHLARQQSIARGSAQHAMHCFGFNSAKEGEGAEGQQCKARSPEGVLLVLPRARGPVRGAGSRGSCQASPGTHGEPGHSFTCRTGDRPWEGPQSATAALQRPPKGKHSLPAFVPRIYNAFTVYKGSASPCPSPAS